MSGPLDPEVRSGPVAASPGLAGRRCLNHPPREAAARCPECRHDFCRECVTDHGGRAICAACLAKLSDAAAIRRRRAWAWLPPALSLLGGLATAWFYFYLIAQVLLLFPQAVDTTAAPGASRREAGGTSGGPAGSLAPPGRHQPPAGSRP